MKSKPNPASLLKVLLSVAAGIAIGWSGKGMVTGRGSGSQGAVVPTVEISRTGSSAAASPTSQSPGGVSTEEPKVIAKRLFQAVIDGTQEEDSEELLMYRFRHVVAACDEAAVAEMLEIIMRHASDRSEQIFIYRSSCIALTEVVMVQMAMLNPRKALDGLVGLAQAGMPYPTEVFYMAMALPAEKDPAEVQKMIEGLSPEILRFTAQFAFWQARSKSDPEGVFQSLMNLDADARDSLSSYPRPLQELLQNLALQAPEKALQAAARFPKESFSSVRNEIMDNWLQSEPTAAAQWAMEQNDAAMFNVCFQYYGYRNSELDEETLRANFLTIQPSGSADSVQLAQTLAERLAIKDMPEAIRWVATLPTEAREEANVVVATAWFQTDVPAAAQWLKSWPEGGSRDKAVSRLVNCLVDEDPEGALAWAVSMKSSDRYERMQYAMNSLTFEDPAAAARALQALSEEDRAALSILKNHKLEIK